MSQSEVSVDPFEGWGVRVSNSKSFGDEPAGFDQIKRVNVIVGQNNSGKSTLLSVIAAASGSESLKGRGDKEPELSFFVPFHLYQRRTQEITVPIEQMLATLDGARVEIHKDSTSAKVTHRFALIKTQIDRRKRLVEDWSRVASGRDLAEQSAVQGYNYNDELRVLEATLMCIQLVIETAPQVDPFQRARVIRIAAQRAIRPDAIKLQFEPGISQGTGAFINQFINWLSNRDPDNKRTAIRTLLFRELNSILETEDRVDDISTINPGNDPHRTELILSYHSDDKPSSIAVSDCGTGLGTILQVLVSVLFLPQEMLKHASAGRKGDGKTINLFLFEELENNLHPSTLRRLLRFIEQQSTVAGNYFFLTTHSPVVIDYFNDKENAQILHVQKENGTSRVTAVSNPSGGYEILEDLGFRASDVLQSNCIVWVEGPSDIIHFKHWIDVWSDGLLKSELHYLCLFYGGDTTKYLGVNLEEDGPGSDVLVNFVKANRNVIFIADRDTDNPEKIKSKTVSRIQKEVNEAGGIAWITRGREVENYMTAAMLQSMFGKEVALKNEYEDVPDILGKQNCTKQKIPLAKQAANHWTKEIIESSLDLKDRLDQVVAFIKKCNHMD